MFLCGILLLLDFEKKNRISHYAIRIRIFAFSHCANATHSHRIRIEISQSRRIRIAFAFAFCEAVAFASHSHLKTNANLYPWLSLMFSSLRSSLMILLFQKDDEEYQRHFVRKPFIF